MGPPPHTGLVCYEIRVILKLKESAARVMDEQIAEEEVTPFHAAEFLDPIFAEESKGTDELLDDDRKPNLAETSCPALCLPIEPKQEGRSLLDLRAPAPFLPQHASSMHHHRFTEKQMLKKHMEEHKTSCNPDNGDRSKRFQTVKRLLRGAR